MLPFSVEALLSKDYKPKCVKDSTPDDEVDLPDSTVDDGTISEARIQISISHE